MDETLFQAANFYIRGNLADAQANLAHIAGLCTVDPDRPVGFGTPPYRGTYLGTFLEAAEIMGTPANLPSG